MHTTTAVFPVSVYLFALWPVVLAVVVGGGGAVYAGLHALRWARMRRAVRPARVSITGANESPRLEAVPRVA